MSLDLCTDQLVLALLPPDRIASVTWLARDPSGSLFASRAARVATNHGQAEEVLRQRPDLVIAGTFAVPTTRALLKRLGTRVVEVPEASDLAGIAVATRTVAAAVGEPARGEALLADMTARFAALSRLPPPKVRVAAWTGDGFGARPGSLAALVLDRAGATMLYPNGRGNSVESLLAAAPDLLVMAPATSASGRDATARHPLVRRYWGSRTVTLPPAWTACGTPFIAEAAARLRLALTRAAATPRPPLPFAQPVRAERRRATALTIRHPGPFDVAPDRPVPGSAGRQAVSMTGEARRSGPNRPRNKPGVTAGWGSTSGTRQAGR